MKKTVSFAFGVVVVSLASLLALACSGGDAQASGPAAKASSAKTFAGSTDTLRGATAQAAPSAAPLRTIR